MFWLKYFLGMIYAGVVVILIVPGLLALVVLMTAKAWVAAVISLVAVIIGIFLLVSDNKAIDWIFSR